MAGIVANFYEVAAGILREMLLEVNPTASDDQLTVAVSAFGLASEGSVILNSRLYGFFATPAQLIESTMAHILSILGVE